MTRLYCVDLNFNTLTVYRCGCQKSAFYLDIHFEINNEWRLKTKLYNKRGGGGNKKKKKSSPIFGVLSIYRNRGEHSNHYTTDEVPIVFECRHTLIMCHYCIEVNVRVNRGVEWRLKTRLYSKRGGGGVWNKNHVPGVLGLDLLSITKRGRYSITTGLTDYFWDYCKSSVFLRASWSLHL
jgi:hypothetical protein